MTPIDLFVCEIYLTNYYKHKIEVN